VARPVDPTKYSRFILLASVCIIIAGLYFSREVLIPIALAILLSFLLSPPVRWMERIKFPRAVATLVAVIFAVSVIGGIGYAVWYQFTAIVNQVPTYETLLKSKLQHFGGHGEVINKFRQEVKTISSSVSPGQPSTRPAPAVALAPPANPPAGGGLEPLPATPGSVPANAPTTRPTPEHPLPVREYPDTGVMEVVREYASRFLYPLATAGLVVVFAIFMLLSHEDLRDRFIRLVGHGRLNLTTQAMDEAAKRISSYLGALSIVNGAYALCVAGGLWAIGHFLGHGTAFPNVLVWGVLVGLLRFVPYVGIWIGAAAPLLLSFAIFKGNAAFFGTIGLFTVLEIVVGQFIEPFWYGSTTGMSALAVLVAAVFWTWLWGPIGLLLSTPLTVCLVVVGKYVPQLKFLDILLRDKPVLPPATRFYQRLIAADPDEATELAHEYLKEKNSLEATYDDVLIPALSMADQDNHRGRLDDALYVTIRQSIREIVEELADQYRLTLGHEATGTPDPGKAASALSSAASSVAAAATSVAHAITGTTAPNTGAPVDADKIVDSGGKAVVRRPHLPGECKITVLILPARAQADEIVAAMLAQLLEVRGYCTVAATSDVLAGEMVDMVEGKKADLVCVSAMPPAALAHARYLCKRLHAVHPDIKLVVGLWTLKTDINRARERIACSGDVQVTSTLHEAQEQIEQFARPLMVLETQAAAGKENVRV